MPTVNGASWMVVLKLCHPRPLFVYFRLFKQTIQFLQQINVKKCPSSIWCWDSNPRPSEHESPPITTRPGLPPKNGASWMVVTDNKLCSWLSLTYLLYESVIYFKGGVYNTEHWRRKFCKPHSVIESPWNCNCKFLVNKNLAVATTILSCSKYVG